MTKNNKPLNSYGVVFNTDTSKGSGQHWFAIYITTNAPKLPGSDKCHITIELFNSSGQPINNDEFNKFWTQVSIDIQKETGCDCDYSLVSNIQHQKDSTGNCGAYSIYYIYNRLNGMSSSDFDNREHKITDKHMEKFRTFLFRNENSLSLF